MREIPIREKLHNWQMDQHVFIIPRSADPMDYGVITTLDDEELLRRGLNGEIIFHGFGPSMPAAEREIKQYLRGLIKTRLGRRNRRRRRVKLSFLPLLLLLMLIPPLLVDEMLAGVAMFFLMVFLQRVQGQESRHQQRIADRIDQVRIKEDPLLSAAYGSLQSFGAADGREPHLVDFQRAASGMPAEQRALTLEGIRRYLELHQAGPLRRAIHRVNNGLAPARGIAAVTGRIKRVFLELRLLSQGGDRGQSLEPASVAIYKDLLSKAQTADRAGSRQRAWDIIETSPWDSGSANVELPRDDAESDAIGQDPARRRRREGEHG